MKVFISQSLKNISCDKAMRNIENAKKGLRYHLVDNDIEFVYRDPETWIAKPDAITPDLIQELTEMLEDCNFYAFLPDYDKSDISKEEYFLCSIASRDHGVIIESVIMKDMILVENTPMEFDKLKEYIGKQSNARNMVFQLNGKLYPIYGVDTRFAKSPSTDDNCLEEVYTIVLKGD